jgi:type I restriction enzyme M protein
MSKRITLEELKSYLWNSAVLLRTHIGAGSYKQYIFPLLFFKRISDVWNEECNQALEEYGDEEVAFFPEIHCFNLPNGHHWKDVRETSENVGVAIVNAFRAIERANANKLMGVFGDGAWTNKNRLPDELLKDMIEHFSTLTLSIENCPEDELGQGYEYLIRKFADDSGHTAQEFYTNRTVVHLMTELLKPQSGESVYDPTCGSAGMLISAIAYLKTQGKEWRNVKIFGQEINALTSAIARINLFLHGVKDFQIVNDDTLTNPALIENGQLQRFDMIVANPPYSISQWNREAFAADKYGRNFLGTPPQGRADYAFFQHILKSLGPKTGRCAILFPHGVLFRAEEISLREKLIKTDLVECVIGLGANLFYNSPMEACIVICRTSKTSARRGQILIINAVNDVTRKNAQSYLEDAHIKKIADAYGRYADIDGFSKVITIADAENNNYSLSIPLYVREVIDEEAIDSRSVNECATAWLDSAFEMRTAYRDLKLLIEAKDNVYTLEPPELLMVAESSKDSYNADGGNADEDQIG